MQLKVNDLKIKLMSKRMLDKSATFFNGLMRCIFTWLVFSVAVSQVNAQGWDILFGGNGEDQAYSVIQTNDEGFIAVGFSQSFSGSDPFFDFNVYAVRTDVDGTVIWAKPFSEDLSANVHDYGYQVLETEDEGFLIVGALIENNSRNVYLLRIDKYGNVLWKKTYGTPEFEETGFDIVEAKDGEGFIIIGLTSDPDVGGSSDILVIRVDGDGSEIWTQTYGGPNRDEGTSIVALEDGFVFSAISKEDDDQNNNILLTRIDSQGEIVWSETIGEIGVGEEVRDLILTRDGNHLVMVGASNSLANSMVAKYDLEGDEVWTTEIDGESRLNDVVEIKGGDFVACGYKDVTPFKQAVLMVKVDFETGDLIWEKSIEGNIRTKFAEGLAETNEGGFIVTGYNSLSDFTAFNDVMLIKTDENGDLITNHIIGKVYYSTDGCNEYEEGDVDLKDWIVKAESDNATYFGTTDENGNYDIRVDSGFYTVSLLTQNPYWSVCNVEFTIDFNTFYDTTSFYFPVEAELDCPWLTVNVSSDEVVVCEDFTYTVNYANLGPVTVNDPYIEVQLDDELEFVNASIDWEALGGNLLRFGIDDVLPTNKDTFTIDVAWAEGCEDVQEDQAIVISAHAYPDTLCLEPGPEWDGSSLAVTGVCDQDSIRFYVQNVGEVAMAEGVTRTAFIVEDQIIFNMEPIEIEGLEPAEILELPAIKANGSTFRIIAEQSIDHPGYNYPTVAVEGCVEEEGESYSTGQYAQFPENDQDPYISIDVKEAISSNSPVILRGYPRGYQDSIITPTTDLNYTIVFQNLGTDTISRLVIRDTLPAFLDRTTIRPGASSHPYDFQIYDNGVLKFTFEEIQLLPGSSADAALTRGFVKFAIPQLPDNPLGTIIENSAAIYFDYEEPVYTNVTRHFVGCLDFLDEEEGCITVDTDGPTIPGLEIKVYPNPFNETVTIEIGGGYENEEVTFNLFDITGRLLRSQQFIGNKYDFNRNQLPSGLYIFKLESSEGKQIGSGKMLIR
ncbi:MAG: T9SS C-terminal target domain-containing protein [Bacteroidetes bacterium]|nr:MAG: T9SS C-terminal target domain-containing protein [Bacteroidota bacterium]